MSKYKIMEKGRAAVTRKSCIKVFFVFNATKRKKVVTKNKRINKIKKKTFQREGFV